jgi:hypothetical protein
MGRPRTRLPPSGAFAAFAFVALTAASGCQPTPSEPIDPTEPTPLVSCEEGGPVTLTRTTADSSLQAPPWVEVCSLCPSDSFSVELTASDAPVDAIMSWARGTGCAVAMPTAPVPETGVQVTYRVASGDRSGVVTLDVGAARERGPNPEGLTDMTFDLDWAAARSRHPHQGDPRLADPEGGPSLLISVGAPDAEGNRPVIAGVSVANGPEQDLCIPTAAWGTARIDTRQLGGSIDPGATILQPTPIPVLGGALQGRLNESGEGLFDVALLGIVDLSALQPVLGAVADVCDTLIDLDMVSACGPCTSPADGAADQQQCITAVWEWAAVARTDQPLTPVAANALPPDC